MAPRRNRGAELLVEWRKKSSLTQFEAAVLLGIDPSPLSKIERGRRRPGRQTAIRIAEKTGGAVPVEAWDEEPGEATTTAVA